MDSVMENKSSEHEHSKVNLHQDKYYTLCEYNIDTDCLIHTSGKLLENFGCIVPARFSELISATERDPVLDALCKPRIKEYVLSVLKGDNIISDSSCGIDFSFEKDEKMQWVHLLCMPVKFGSGKYVEMLFLNIDEEKAGSEFANMDSDKDSLTGALNRDAIKNAVEEMAANDENNVFILMDIDGFRKLNEKNGHAWCDSMLVEVVNKLRQGLRKNDIIGRIGGDEFFIGLRNASSRESVERIAKHMCILARHALFDGMLVSASLGIVFSPKHGKSFDELFLKADEAMFAAKKRGGNCYVFYGEHNDDSEEDVSYADSVHASLEGRTIRYLYSHYFIIYDIESDTFEYSENFKEKYSSYELERSFFDNLKDYKDADERTILQLRKKIEEISKSDEPSIVQAEYLLRDKENKERWYRVSFVCPQPHFKICISFIDIQDEVNENQRLIQLTEYDELTGMLNRSAFCNEVDSVMKKERENSEKGEYSLIFLDIIKFKAVNDMFGRNEGDKLLVYVSDIINRCVGEKGIVSRIGSDRFGIFVKACGMELIEIIDTLFDRIGAYDLSFKVTCNAGIYVTTNEKLPANSMIDRAALALSAIKGSYSQKYCIYDESLRSDMLGEQEIVGAMASAITEKQFLVYYQPQFNHLARELTGAEALVRWGHKEKGLVSPGVFIPIFEKNGFITTLDYYVFENACMFIRKCLDMGLKVVPVSTNFSRLDIFNPEYVNTLEEIRKKYNVPSEYLRIEITESAIVGSSQAVNDVIDKLHKCGYIVEMDDFGSGYSSLNILKEIDFDILKLDMKFLSGEGSDEKGRIILSYIARMASELRLPIIAEGVETENQADFLSSIGCEYFQGYLYSKPVPENDYLEIVKNSDKKKYM